MATLRAALGPPDAPDRFALLRELGSGAMGVVYEALDHSTRTRVALKTVHENKSRFLVDLKREFRAVHNVEHPNLVRLGDLFQSDDAWFFTMELVRGRTYLHWLCQHAELDEVDRVAAPTLRLDRHYLGTRTDDPSPARPSGRVGETPDNAARLRVTLPQLAGALIALHDAGLVHRDIKPSNILITDEGRLVLLDFGLVRAISADDEPSWSLAGTPAYMAPEQAAEQGVTAAADCYAVGVIMYQALTGTLPFVGGFRDLVVQKKTWTPVAPRVIAPNVPADLERLCLDLLAVDPAARPTAEDIVVRVGGRLGRAPRQRDPIPPFAGPVAITDEELARIRVAFDGRPAVVIVDGEPGSGNNAPLGEVARQLTRDRDRALVLRGRCFERELAAHPGVDMIVDALVAQLRRFRADRVAFFTPRHLGALRRLFPALGGIPAFSEQDAAGVGWETHLHATIAFEDLFARVALRHEVVLVIDDAQWLTDDSLTLLRSLLDPEDGSSIVLLLAARGPETARLSRWLEQLACRVVRADLGASSSSEGGEPTVVMACA